MFKFSYYIDIILKERIKIIITNGWHYNSKTLYIYNLVLIKFSFWDNSVIIGIEFLIFNMKFTQAILSQDFYRIPKQI